MSQHSDDASVSDDGGGDGDDDVEVQYHPPPKMTITDTTTTKRATLITSMDVDIVLSRILQTRLQRKAKAILLSGIEFLIADLAILYSAIDLNVSNKDIELGMFILTGIAALYILTLVIFLFIHSNWYTSDEATFETSPKVEEAFAKTNRIPVVDGLLELPYPAVHKGTGELWYLPYISWSFCAAIIIAGGVLFSIVQEDVPAAATSVLAASALLLYQISSDFSEYWVYSRNQQKGVVNADEGGLEIADAAESA